MKDLERIAERVHRLGDPDDPQTPRPLLAIDEFFEGNTVVGSIGCNLAGEPSPEMFYAALQAIAHRPDVEDIRVQITAFDDPDWPYSDIVYVMTSSAPEEVATWFPQELRPDETWEGFVDQPYEPYAVPPGMKPIACWWD